MQAKPFTTLKKRRDFVAMNTRAQKFITGCFILQALPNNSQSIRIGYTVTKKLGGAVVRNRIKRRLREAARQVLPKQAKPGYDYVFIARAKAQACDFSELTRDMEFAFSRIILHKRQDSSTKDS